MPFRIEQGHGWYVWDANEREYVLNFCHGTFSHYELKPDFKTKVAKPRLICDRCGQDITDAIDLRNMVNGGD
jgi:uncharacterized CHY-type Zn-finger protein